MLLRLGKVYKHSALPETAFGLSRFTLDALLLNQACEIGAQLRESCADPDLRPMIIAGGRRSTPVRQPRGARLFGFKAHYSGPQDDAIELYFGAGWYVGVNSVERGLTNVCGLAQENLLSRYGFDCDELCATDAALFARLSPLQRSMRWICTGPLTFHRPAHTTQDAGLYRAGDALSFVDPFTGSGILNAIVTGSLAADAVARGNPTHEYVARCGRRLGSSYRFAAVVRWALTSGAAEQLLRLIPGQILFQLTRTNSGRILTKENR